MWADCPGVSGAVSPEKLHLGGGLGVRRLAALAVGRLFLLGRGRLVLRKSRGGESEDEAESEGDAHEFLHSFLCLLL